MKLNLKILVKRILFLLLIAASAQLSIAQNIIPNPSFEDTTGIGLGYFFPTNWSRANQGSSDYYTIYHDSTSIWASPQNFIGYQAAYKGIGYMGIGIYILYTPTRDERRDYIQLIVCVSI